VNLDRDARQIAREKVAPAVRARLAFALRRFRRGSVTLRFFDRRVEVRLQLRLGRQQIAKCELQLARHAALAPRPEQPPLEQRVLMREVGKAVLECGHLRRRCCALRSELGL
jgi:hypothetical protein